MFLRRLYGLQGRKDLRLMLPKQCFCVVSAVRPAIVKVGNKVSPDETQYLGIASVCGSSAQPPVLPSIEDSRSPFAWSSSKLGAIRGRRNFTAEQTIEVRSYRLTQQIYSNFGATLPQVLGNET